ncbi:MAG TPA: hypothetical protein ENI79_01240 [Rhodospirillales bacterium]|nr:hypothetical protein [Rhodospirillales bacterium]
MAVTGFVIAKQVDAAAPCGMLAACSPLANGTGSAGRNAVEGGTGGTSEVTSQIAAKSAQNFAGFEIEDSLGFVTPGDWTVRVDVTTAAAMNWSRVYVCVVNAACSSLATIGSNVSVGISLSTTGIKTATVTCSQYILQPGEKIYIVCVAENGTFGALSVGWTPNQNIDTTLIRGTARLRRLIEGY